MAFAGMDIEAALGHARTLETNAADEIFRVLTAMEGIVPRLMEVWHGEDADRFVQDWSQHRQNLSTVHTELCDVAASVTHAIRQQQQISEA